MCEYCKAEYERGYNDAIEEMNRTKSIVIKEEKIEKIEYGNKEINDTLAFLKKACGVSDFKESSGRQRMYCKHIINLTQKISKEEMIERLKGILGDEFKAKNCNKIVYLYGELKSYIHSPVIVQEVKEIKITY